MKHCRAIALIAVAALSLAACGSLVGSGGGHEFLPLCPVHNTTAPTLHQHVE